MKPAKLNIRTCLACSNLWKIDREEKEMLDRFFILYDTGESLFKDIEKRENPHYPFESEYFLKFIEENGQTTVWNVRFLKPISVLKALNKENQIGLSFREHRGSRFNWVVISEWKERTNDGQ